MTALRSYALLPKDYITEMLSLASSVTGLCTEREHLTIPNNSCEITNYSQMIQLIGLINHLIQAESI